MIRREHNFLSVRKQCELLGLGLSSYYYRNVESKNNDLELMRKIDEIYLENPCYGSRKITKEMRRRGNAVNRKRVRRLMQIMGIRAIYRAPRTSQPHPEHKVYPYLLRNIVITQPNQVWCADITYIRLKTGWAYLVAIMDWHSRKVLSWRLSNSMDTDFCIRALNDAFRFGNPDIFNTDQGAQFTSQAFTGLLKDMKIRISMDGKGRCIDNVFIERLWRSVKYEEVYLNEYQNMRDARISLHKYFVKYNSRRIHQSLDYMTPDEVYRRKAS